MEIDGQMFSDEEQLFSVAKHKKQGKAQNKQTLRLHYWLGGTAFRLMCWENGDDR